MPLLERYLTCLRLRLRDYLPSQPSLYPASILCSCGNVILERPFHYDLLLTFFLIRRSLRLFHAVVIWEYQSVITMRYCVLSE